MPMENTLLSIIEKGSNGLITTTLLCSLRTHCNYSLTADYQDTKLRFCGNCLDLNTQ